MKLVFPSHEFDEAVAAACHGTASNEEAQALNELLHSNPAARDEYILRLEVHSRLASAPDLFASALGNSDEPLSQAGGARASARFNVHPTGVPETSGALPEGEMKRRERRAPVARLARTIIALAACFALLAAGWWGLREWRPGHRKGATSRAVAMLNRVVDAEWAQGEATPRLGAPLEPGRLHLNAGLVQIVFYSGTRVVIEGPAELQLIAPAEAVLLSGRLVAEVPPQAKGFRVRTSLMNVTGLGTVFGVEVRPRQTELHVFKGRVEFQSPAGTARQNLPEGQGAVADGTGAPRLIPVNPVGFASLFDLQNKSSEAEVLRHEQWRAASSRLDEDSSLLVHFDFEQADPSDWRLPNASRRKDAPSDAAIVGCQWTEGRWPDKRALEFRGVSDRVRFGVPGEFDALTLAVWLRVQGLDRRINSLFMSDGFEAGTAHWSIRQDGVLGLTAIGSEPGRYQICASPPALTLNQFGLWVHLAVVIDGGAKQVTQFLNGVPVSEQALNINPPFRIGVAELGNWNAQGFPGNDPFMIRNFSGAMDEFCLFSRALGASEVRALFSAGKPQPDPLVPPRN